ncbi:MAG TPA: hypothetical protein VMQ54_06040, partial [Steroidobacteraceae bacterium]|nr:hypothetical protein [Steroidobacteraceae bacterium]
MRPQATGLSWIWGRGRSLFGQGSIIEAVGTRLPWENLKRGDLHAELIAGDATAPAAWWDGVPFDRILLDAPCSALGVIRRHPDIRLRKSPSEIDKLPLLQGRLLAA